jgi:hypothetical protein
MEPSGLLRCCSHKSMNFELCDHVFVCRCINYSSYECQEDDTLLLYFLGATFTRE